MTVTHDEGATAWTGGPPPTQPEPARQSSKRRWIIALVVGLVLLGAIVIVFLWANQQTAAAYSPLARYAPAASAVYGEARLDLPGDQRDNLVSFLSHFPGFADPATFDQKINDTIDQLLLSMDAGVDWSTDIEPWFGGQLALFASAPADRDEASESATVAVSVRDRALVEQFIASQPLSAGLTGEEYRGRTIWTGQLDGEQASLVVTDDALLLAMSPDDLRASLDAFDGTAAGLTANETFSQHMSALDANRLAAVFIDATSLLDYLDEPLPSDLPLDIDQQLAGLAGTIVAELRTEGDHMLVEYRMRPVEGRPLPSLPPTRSTNLAERFPPDCIAYIEVRDLGVTLRDTLQQVLELAVEEGLGDELPLDQFEQFLGVSLAEFPDFLGDGAVSFWAEGERIGGGIVSMVNDEAVGRARLVSLATMLRALAAFGGSGVPIGVREEAHGDATVTVVTIEGEDMPFSSLSYTLSDGLLYVGLDDFVTEALDRVAADSLAADARYAAALNTVGAANAGLFYTDIDRLRGLVEMLMLAEGEDDEQYRQEVQPYLEPFAQLIGADFTENDELVVRVLLFVD